jgi:hypothetical protein
MTDDELLMDLGIRPSSGMVHWGRAVRLQLHRVREARDQELANLTHTAEAPQHSQEGDNLPPEPYPTAHERLHVDTHFLVLAIRNVLRFHDAIAARLSDTRLAEARREFMRQAPDVIDFRDFYEHLDDYVQGKGRKLDVPAAPMLRLSHSEGTLFVLYDERRLEVLAAAKAAEVLAQTTARVWFEAVNPYGASIEPLTF